MGRPVEMFTSKPRTILNQKQKFVERLGKKSFLLFDHEIMLAKQNKKRGKIPAYSIKMIVIETF